MKKAFYKFLLWLLRKGNVPAVKDGYQPKILVDEIFTKENMVYRNVELARVKGKIMVDVEKLYRFPKLATSILVKLTEVQKGLQFSTISYESSKMSLTIDTKKRQIYVEEKFAGEEAKVYTVDGVSQSSDGSCKLSSPSPCQCP